LGKITHYFSDHKRNTVNVTTKKINEANVLASATIAQADIDAKIDTIAQESGKQLKVDGFRQGKVPAHVVKKLYGEKLAEDAEGEALRDLITQAYSDAGINPADVLGDPMFKKYDKNDNGIDIEIQLCLRPTIETKDYQGVTPAYDEPKVTAKEIDERIKVLSAQAAPLEELKTKRPLQKGDTAVFDFEGFVDGVAFEGGKADNYELEIGSGQFIPGFEEGMEGLNVGDEKRVPVTFPADYQAENLKGKEAEFAVKLHAIKIKGDVELNDALAQKITNDDKSTVESFKKGTEEQIKAEKFSKLYNEELKPAITEALVAHFTFDLPENIVEQEIDNLVNQKAQSMTPEEIKAVQEDSAKLDALREEVRDDATSSVKATFIIDALAKEEKISITDDEVNQTLYYEAIMAGQNAEELIEYYQKNNLLPAVKMSMLEDKLYSRLLGLDKQ
jgi:trigger factor